MRELERRSLDMLNLVLDQSRRKRREVDEYGGYCRGTTSQLLMGKIELKLRHILDILEVCEVEPKVFFRAVTADFNSSVETLPPLEDQIHAAARLHGLDPETAIAEADRRLGLGPEIPIEDLVAMVSRHVALALEDKRAREPKPPRKSAAKKSAAGAG